MVYLDGVKLSKKIIANIEQFLKGFKMHGVTVIIADVSKKASYWMADEFFQTLPYPGDYVFRAWNCLEDKTVIVFKDEAETEESLFWVIIHEITHLEVRSGWLLVYSGLYYETEKKAKSLGLTFPGYINRIRKDDALHESDPEEEICNRVATSLIRQDYGRKWWREQLLKKTS